MRTDATGDRPPARADAGEVVAAATAELGREAGVRGARGALVHDDALLVVHFRLEVEPSADLGALTRSTERVAARVHQVLDGGTLRCRFTLGAATGAARP